MPLILALLALPAFNLAQYEKPRVVAQADQAIQDHPLTIVSAVNPRSEGGPHDWSSEGDYWWPNPANPNGPYLQRDGLTNPDNFVAHRTLLLAFTRDFDAEAAAYLVTKNEKYAQAATAQLLAWFVDPATKMNPNLEYAQAITHLNKGRSIGVIDTLHLAEVARGIEVLRGSKAFTKADDEAVTGWFREYLHWLKTSQNGLGESRATNNHGTCWVLQAASFAQLVGDTKTVDECRKRFKEVLLPDQMAPNGSFPQELARTKSYGYSIFNLDVMTALAELVSTPEENMMTYALPDGRSLVKGVAFMAPYLADKAKWPNKPDVMYWNDWPVRQPALIFGALASGNETWLKTWESLNPDPTVPEIRRNYPIRQPLLWVR